MLKLTVMTSGDEIGIEKARARLGGLADQAYYAGRITILTSKGVPRAAIVPLSMLGAEKRCVADIAQIVRTPQPVERLVFQLNEWLWDRNQKRRGGA